jgi:CBS domain-containing protein
MIIADILRTKGPEVITIRSDATIAHAAQMMKDRKVGALVVSNGADALDGILSERDIAFGLAAHGGDLHRMSVADLMTRDVVVCSPADTVVEVMRVMTQRRFRHLPVSDGQRLVGVISIGDALKHRLDEVRMEADVLRDYAIARR